MIGPGPVLVVIPAVSWCYTEHVIALQQLWLPDGSEIVWTRGGTTIAEKREAGAERVARDGRFRWLLCLDSDMTPPPRTVVQLLSHGLPIIGPIMFQRFAPYHPCAGYCNPDGSAPRYLEQAGGPEPVQRVDWCGTGCLLIAREALLAIPRPWFASPTWAIPSGDGSDLWFCLAAAKAQVPVHVDTSATVGHLGVVPIDLDFVARWQETAAARAWTAERSS